MIRRTLKGSLLATVAVLAFLPAAAGAAPASAATTPRPAPSATAQHQTKHRTHHTRYRTHHVGRGTHRVHHRRLHIRRVHRFTAEGVARAVAQGMSYRRTFPTLGRVATRHARLNVRSGPGTTYRVIGHRHTRQLLAITCETYGTGVLGNHIWYRLPHHRGYVAARYVVTHRAVPWC
ncbi:hypothetical protein [Streptomyces sp. NPDC007905]|uniref:hypothetical protein n=1 Tax=Streptomyces sp. NPDC007905 TaxID=3364788 RepID=UPI0036EAF8E4